MNSYKISIGDNILLFLDAFQPLYIIISDENENYYAITVLLG